MLLEWVKQTGAIPNELNRYLCICYTFKKRKIKNEVDTKNQCNKKPEKRVLLD